MQSMSTLQLLEVMRSSQTSLQQDNCGMVVHSDLSLRELDKHLSKTGGQVPKLRVFFANKTGSGDRHASFNGTTAPANADNAIPLDHLTQKLEVCPDFIPNFCPQTPWLWSTGNALRKRWATSKSSEGDSSEWAVSSIEGFCRYSLMDQMRDRRVRVWFQHDLVERTSTYIIHNCSSKFKTAIQDKVKSAIAGEGPFGDLLCIDYIIVNEVVGSWLEKILDAYKKLLQYEHLKLSEYHDDRIDSAAHELHDLAQTIHVLQEEIHGLLEQIDFLIDTHSLIMGDPQSFECLSNLRSRTNRWHDWLRNFRERTNIRIQLWFHLATQRDNRTNIRIAELTSRISEQTQKDSSAMIAIAALTLVFLPGTFISSIFSMSFFNFEDSNKSVSIASNVWLYPAVAVPFTIIVIMAWNWWAKHRKPSNNGAKVIDEKSMRSDESLTSAGHWWNCDSDKEVRVTNISLGGQILPVVRGGGTRQSRPRSTSDATERP